MKIKIEKTMRLLDQLQADAQAAVKLIRERRELFPNAVVNWADFRAVGADRVLSNMTDPSLYWRVTLKEAAPENADIAVFVAGQLWERWGYVEVVTEW